MITQEHVHIAEHTIRTDGGTFYEVCECGATRNYSMSEIRARMIPGWHTCELCTHPWGLNKENNATDQR